MLILIAYTFTIGVYAAANATPESLHFAPIAIVDEDDSTLSKRIVSAFNPPQFTNPAHISLSEVDPALDAGIYTFVLNIPPNFQRDVLAGKSPQLQLNIDATRMSQAFTGNSYIQQIAMGEINEFVQRYRSGTTPQVDLTLRSRFNQSLKPAWFGGLMEAINNITMLSIILTGAALIREREHGTVEHLLAMPILPIEIMLAKIWSMGLVVLLTATISLVAVIGWLLKVPLAGSLMLFLAGASLHLFATTSMGIFMATLARSMPQFGLLIMLVLLPLEMLSGGVTPRESMPELIQNIMLASPTTHFVELSQAILFRGAGFDVVWTSFLSLFLIGILLFTFSLSRFRKTITQFA